MKLYTKNKLAIAQATQHTNNDVDSDWVIHSDGEELWRLPAVLTPQQAMDVIHFGREFEKRAFNNGIEFQKQKTPDEVKMLRNMVQGLTIERDALRKENERIGAKLDELLTSEY